MSLGWTPDEAWYRAEAKKKYHDEGFLEIDCEAPVSRATGSPTRGAYVQAWVWVDYPVSNEQIADGMNEQPRLAHKAS